MATDDTNQTDRRTFLQAGALAAASALGTTPGSQAQDAAPKPMELPRRPLGKTGIDITILDQGTGKGPDVDRLLRYGFARGVRAYDTSETYHSEGAFKKWFVQDPAVRKQIFLVTKDAPRVPAQIMGMLDKRLAALGTDYIDLFFIHSFGDNHTLDDAIAMVKSKRAEGRVGGGQEVGEGPARRHLDASQGPRRVDPGGGRGRDRRCDHAPVSPVARQGLAAQQGDRRRLHERGIGLISMKQIAGHFLGDKPHGNILDEVVRRVPVLAERKLTPYQGLLHAIWTDERMSAVCTTMRNTDHIRENTDAAGRYEPLKQADIHQLRDATLAHGTMLCADCDGRCSVAAGTRAELGNLTRFLTYHEHHGDRAEARRLYAELPPEARDWSGADLEAARAACPNRLDFARFLPQVEEHLA